MSARALWADALEIADDGANLHSSVLRHIRDAIFQGYVSRGRITAGIKEAFRPLGFDDLSLGTAIDEALNLLVETGDVDELSTAAGRGYAPTPPRRVTWGGARDILLGAIFTNSAEAVRHIVPDQLSTDAATFTLRHELGRTAWRDHLVELGGADQPDASPSALSSYAQALAGSGERFALDEPNSLAVISGAGDFFGSPDPLSGRWQRASAAGFFAGVVTSGFAKRRVVLNISDGEARLWEPPTRDIWNWIVVGETLTVGGNVCRYDPGTERFDFLTPPPRQAERAALLTGERLSAWSWRIDRHAQTIIAELLGSPPA